MSCKFEIRLSFGHRQVEVSPTVTSVFQFLLIDQGFARLLEMVGILFLEKWNFYPKSGLGRFQKNGIFIPKAKSGLVEIPCVCMTFAFGRAPWKRNDQTAFECE